ncbi:MAG: lysylphosphatidylglycerol synthase domain-containing protein [Gammaproteobacteria bacterium]
MRQQILALLRTTGVLAGLLYLCRTLGNESALRAIGQSGPLAAGFGLTIASFACYAARFRASLRCASLEIGFGTAFRVCARALFHHCFVPLSIGNDLSRFLLARAARPGMASGPVARAIVGDHAIGTAALLLLAGAGMGVFVDTRGWPAIVPLAAGAIVVAGVLLARRDRAGALHRLAPLFARRRPLAEALLCSLAMQALLAAAIHVVATAAGLDASWHVVLAVNACGSLLQVIPFNLGGLHLGDVAATGLYVWLGLSFGDALVLGSLAYVARLSVALIGGVLDAVPHAARDT